MVSDYDESGDVRIDTEELVSIPWLTRLFVWLRWLPREQSHSQEGVAE